MGRHGIEGPGEETVRPVEWTRASGWSRRRFVGTGLGALAAPIMLGCGGDDPTGPGQSSDPRLTARPGTPTLDPPPGRSDLGLDPQRDGFMYVPSGYSSAIPAPLFVALHGAGVSSSDWAGYIPYAEERGFVLLAPDSRTLSWDIAELGYFGPDVEFIDQALVHTFDRCRIDPSRIALAGFSDGASYALSLGVSNGDLFTHLIAHSAGFFTPAAPIVGKPPVFQSHGTNDPILPITSGRYIEGLLRDDGYDVTFEEFDGGHQIPFTISQNALDWFLDVS